VPFPTAQKFFQLHTLGPAAHYNKVCHTASNVSIIIEYNSVDQATTHLQSTSSEVKQLFSEVVKLIRCLLVLPTFSCEAERCFSSLRRLKSYLCSTITQKRLKSVTVCHIHQDVQMSIPIASVIADYVSLNSERQRLFGSTD
jgi:hypothetical protein